MGERRVRNAEVMGSNPTISTSKKRTFVLVDKSAFFELSVPQAEREVFFGREVRFAR